MKSALAFLVVLTLGASPATAQTAKELTTKKGVSVGLVNLVNAKSGCTGAPAPVCIPVIREKPANGTVLMQVVAVDVAATGSCPARKTPAVALLYSPKAGFTGTDSVVIEIEAGNQTTLFTYRISVITPGETL